GGAPVLVEFQAHGAGQDLLFQGLRQAAVTLAEKAQVHGEGLRCLEHAPDVPGPGGAGGGIGAGGGASAAAQHGGDTTHQRLLDLLGTDKVDVGVDTPGGGDQALPGDHLGTRADNDVHSGLNVRVAGLADGEDTAFLEADIPLDHTPVVENQGVGNHRVRHLGGGALALAHPVADHLAAAEFDLFPIAGEILLHPDPQLRVPEPQPIPQGWAKHLAVGLSADGCHFAVLRIVSYFELHISRFTFHV